MKPNSILSHQKKTLEEKTNFKKAKKLHKKEKIYFVDKNKNKTKRKTANNFIFLSSFFFSFLNFYRITFNNK